MLEMNLKVKIAMAHLTIVFGTMLYSLNPNPLLCYNGNYFGWVMVACS